MNTRVFCHCYLTVFLVPFCGFSVEIFSPERPPSSEVGTAESPFFPRTGTSRRWQQVYEADDFVAITNGGGIITSISFNGNAPWGSTLTNVEIHLSITAKEADSLSPVFAENIGFNEIVVQDGPLEVRGPFSSGYNWRIDLETPYYYNPATGNLLLDIKQYGRPPIPPFPPFYGIDASLSATDRAASVNGTDVNLLQGNVTTAALLTMFTITPVPEASTIAFLCAGLVLLMFFRSRVPRM